MKQIKENPMNAPEIGVGTEDEHSDIITLEMEDGSTEDCEILDFLEVDGKQYVALLPLEKEEYYIFEYIENDDESDIRYIDDDAEFEKVSSAFAEYFEEEEFDEDDYAEYEDDSEDE